MFCVRCASSQAGGVFEACGLLSWRSSFLQSSNLNASTHVIDHLYHINNMDDSLNGKQSRSARYKKYLAQDVDKSWADVILIISCSISGLTDSAVFNMWSCYASMQTGM
jgi:hypothetical protein